MSARFRFWLVLVGLVVILLGTLGLIGVGVWTGMNDEARALVVPILMERAGLFVMAVVIVIAALGFLTRTFFDRYVSPPLKLAEGVGIILNANPSHRLAALGGAEFAQLVKIVNAFADQHQALQRDVAAKIRESQQSIEEERNRLAVLISELTQSVIVCNIEGRILLYNSRAKQLLSHSAAEQPAIGGASQVGLGRSVFGIFERSLVTHALESIQARRQKGQSNPVAHFVTTADGGQLIRVQLAPVLGVEAEAPPVEEAEHAVMQKEITGFVLIMDDITKAVESGGRKDVILQSLTEGSRRGLANIRAAVEMLLSYPDMAPPKQGRFLQIISEEVAGLSQRLDASVNEYAAFIKSEWLLEDMLGADFISAVSRRIESKLGISVKVDEIDSTLWLKVESYSLMQAITYLVSRLKDEADIKYIRVRLTGAGRLAHLDLIWSGLVIGTATLPSWEDQALNAGGETSPLTLKEVIERHGGEIWYQVHKPSQTAYFRLLIPVTEPGQPDFQVSTSETSRPEYYDFELFHQLGQPSELDQCKLSDLTYTVFDTECTGLQPSEGDEIVAIGALRIVNGRLLYNEVFEQLVDPRRPMSQGAIEVTGIDPSELKGQPTIDKVLPQFHKFCEDTVLVGHNAAFDMRFLKLKEESTGIRFTQPVLDTLLLSQVILANFDSHRLEASAERFGVNLIGRHTALGDAIVTGEVFLKMLPLLGEKGIRTLRDAREAAARTLYARIQY